MVSFGQRLREVRKAARLTQAELAEQLFVSVQSVSKWECDNAMPDISQIVPLAAVLGVTTDYLLGVGGDENADREALYEQISKINKGIEKVYSRSDDPYHACCALYRAHMKRYPFDYEVKLQCADSIIRILYYCPDSGDEKEKLRQEAVSLLQAVINYDRDTTRLIDAKQLLIILYLYSNDFTNARAVAESLPKRGNIRAAMEIEIYSKMDDHGKCLDLAKEVCEEAIHNYLWALAVKARRISLLGQAHKQEAIRAWQDLLSAAKLNYGMVRQMRIHTKWLYSALNNLSIDYLALSEADSAFAVMKELSEVLLEDYRELTKNGNTVAAEELKRNFRFYLHGCIPEGDPGLTSDPRFRELELLLGGV